MNVESVMREEWGPCVGGCADADAGVGDKSDTRTEGSAESRRIISAIGRTRAQLAAWGHICLGDCGQGTTEYAILVGVLVVIAIVAVTAFRGKLTELWSAITDGINGL